MLRVLVVDDHPIVRLCVRSLIEAHSGWSVCGEAGDGIAGLEAAAQEAPDVVVLDVGLPMLNGIALMRQLRQDRANAKVLLFTAHDDDETISSGLAAGARGFVCKSDVADALEPAIEALAAGRTYFSGRVAEVMLDALSHPRTRSPLEEFTPRELQVAQLMAEAQSNKRIARELGVSLKTVETHRAAVMAKSRCSNIAAFTNFACKHRLVEIRGLRLSDEDNCNEIVQPCPRRFGRGI